MNGIVISSVEIVYNPIEKRKKQKQSEDNFGPTVERTCSACGHNEMTYKTQQMRSADEGMTITKASSLNGIVISSVEIVYNPIEKRKKQKQSEDNFGPTVERTCSACGHNEMTYKTQQMRSADEGMTIFYYCVKCGNMEKEDS